MIGRGFGGLKPHKIHLPNPTIVPWTKCGLVIAKVRFYQCHPKKKIVLVGQVFFATRASAARTTNSP